MDIDLLRLLTAFVVGAVLSFAGSLVQITTRNDLASPSTLGMDGVAVLMVMLSFLLQSLGLNFSLTHLALGLGVITLIVLSFFSSVFLKQRDLKIVVLMGMSVNLLVGAVFSIMQFMAMAFNQKFPDQLWFGRILSLDASSGLGLAFLLVAVIGFML
ncbi:MAG: iron ABC transporter permease, partial [Proteobacteria bacterium]|nr:iron ABC transporter permease [Pseudomonadota bacterium]